MPVAESKMVRRGGNVHDRAVVLVLLPRFLVRVSGQPTNVIAACRTGATALAAHELAALDAAIGEARERASAALHEVIGRVQDSVLRRAAIQLRRDLHNDRPCTAPQRALLEDPSIAPSAAAALALDGLLRARATGRAHVEAIHADELRSARIALQRAIADRSFRRGVLLSSASLASNIDRYLAADPDAMRSRDEQIERGLLRYLLRAAMKATPFSTFCSVGEGRIAESGGRTAIAFDTDPARTQHTVRLNKSVYGALWAHLRRRPAVRRRLPVSRNPTLAGDGDRLVFLAEADGKEIFRRIAETDALHVLIALLSDTDRMELGELVTALAAAPGIESSSADAEAYVDALVENGLLRLHQPVPEQEAEWDRPLLAFLRPIDDDHARLVVDLLDGVAPHLAAYRAADLAACRDALAAITSRLTAAFAALGLPARFVHDLPLYEDTATDAALILHAGADLDGALGHLAELVERTVPLAYPRIEQATMRHFFDRRYDGTDAVPLLRFYEDYSREHLKEQLARSVAVSRRTVPRDAEWDLVNPFHLPEIDAIRMAQARLTQVVRAAWSSAPTAQEVTITPQAVERAIGPAADAAAPKATSMAAFCQVAPADGERPGARIVVPAAQFSTGFGKFYSRFIYVLPGDVGKAVVDRNRSLTAARLAEIGGDADFNANLHPLLTPWRIGYPTGDGDGHEHEIDCRQIDVVRDPADLQALRLVERASGEPILPVDLGFLNPRLRPPLYQLLIRFAPPSAFAIQLPETLDTTNEPRAGITYRPRITYAGSIVIARRRWTMETSCLPVPSSGESAVSYYLRLHAWRRSAGIPSEVYVRVLPPLAERHPRQSAPVDGDEPRAEAQPAAAAPRQPQRRGSRDWAKPQFVDFDSPLLASMFGRLAASFASVGGVRVAFEERYPAAEALPSHLGEARTCELILQFDLPDRRDGTRAIAVAEHAGCAGA